MARMTAEEWRQLVLEKPRPAIAAVVVDGDRPLATPVWIDLDGDQIVFTTNRKSAKGRALERNPAITIVVQDDVPPFSFVIFQGTASLTADPTELRKWAGRLGGRYMGADRIPDYAARNGGPGEVLVRVTATRIIAERAVAS